MSALAYPEPPGVQSQCGGDSQVALVLHMSYCQYLAYQGTVEGGHKGPFGSLV